MMTEPTYKIVELERPHGFLVWKGKQTAIASDELLPVGEPVLIVDGGEAFGLATLSQPAQMVVSEFDRANWKEMHLTHPDERRRFWPDADRLYVHRIEAFEGYQRPKLFDGEQVIDYEPSEAERKLIAQARQLPKQITLKTDAVVMTDGGFVVCDGAGCDDLTAALKATYQKDPRYIEAGGETELPLYRLALVREPRMVVKKKPEAEATADKELEGDDMKAVSSKEQSLEQRLHMIRSQFDMTFNPEAEMAADEPYYDYCWVEQVFDSFVIVEEQERLYRVDYMMTDSAVLFAPRDAWVEVEINYMPKGFTKLAEFKRPEPTKSKLGFVAKLKAARDALGELLNPFGKDDLIVDPDTLTSGKLFSAPSGVMVKTVDGQPWHVTWSTNAFQDREGELFSTWALEQYVKESMAREDRGTFDLWHIEGTDFADKQFQAVIGQFLLEAGPYHSDEWGRAAMEFFKEYSESHPEFAPEGWGSSPEFHYLPEDRGDGVYDWIWITKTSTLRRAAAANVWTAASQEKSIMTLTDEQKRLGEAIWGKDGFAKKIAEGEAKSQELINAGVAYKGNLTGKEANAETATEEVETVTENAEATTEVETEQTTEEVAAVETEEAPEDERPVVQVNVDEVAELVGKQFQADLSPVLDAIAVLGESIQAVTQRVEAMEKKNAVVDKAETPRFILSMKRATEAAETVLDDDSELKEKKPKAAHTEGSHANRFFRNK